MGLENLEPPSNENIKFSGYREPTNARKTLGNAGFRAFMGETPEEPGQQNNEVDPELDDLEGNSQNTEEEPQKSTEDEKDKDNKDK